MTGDKNKPSGAIKTPPPDFTETKTKTETLFSGEMLKVQRDTVRLPDGNTATRELVRHPGAVIIAPLLDENTILLEWQYRYAPGRHLWELPAGKKDPGEDPLTAARRELLEETGYVAARWDFAADLDICVGYSDERAQIYIARDLEYQGHPGEPDEFLHIEKVPLKKAEEMMRHGEITDAKTLIGIMLLLHQYPPFGTGKG